MSRRVRASVLALAALAAALAPASPAAHAQDGKKKSGGAAQAADERPPEKTAEQKVLERIGKDFADKDVDALVARIKKRGKVRLSLGRFDDTYNRDHAKKSLEGWFENRESLEVKLKPSKDTTSLTGTYTLKFRRRTRQEPEVVDLEVRVKKDGERFILKSIKVLPR